MKISRELNDLGLSHRPYLGLWRLKNNVHPRASIERHLCDRLNGRRNFHCLALYMGIPMRHLSWKGFKCQSCIPTAAKEAVSLIQPILRYHSRSIWTCHALSYALVAHWPTTCTTDKQVILKVFGISSWLSRAKRKILLRLNDNSAS